jgi:hypothetical protein
LPVFQKTPYKDPTFKHKAHPRPFIDLTLILDLFTSTVCCVSGFLFASPWSL